MKGRPRLLIIDDEENMCHMLKVMLERQGYEVHTETSAERALALIDQLAFSFVLCDVRMPGMDGLSFVRKTAEKLSDCPVIMMSAYGSVESAIEAMKAGAYDFISKPFKTDEVLLTLKKAEEREQLKKENHQLKIKLQQIETLASFDQMVGESKAIKKVFRLARQVADYDTTILITGASGTGKELIARGIHNCSKRKDKPFVAINCGSIPENLLESELFGHSKGAFTGAEHARRGIFEAAQGSTLFLDEIGELPLAMQVKLLRVLQEREIRPVGSSETKKIDVRVVAATAKDLLVSVREGSFREDLYYRLNVIQITVPPLRDRVEDIPLLCHHFVKKFNNRFSLQVKGVTAEAMNLLLAHGWPGNVRELENAIQRGMVLCQSEFVDVAHLPAAIAPCKGGGHLEVGLDLSETGLSIKSAQRQLEAHLIEQALVRCGGNKSQAAAILELSYPSLLSKIKQYKL